MCKWFTLVPAKPEANIKVDNIGRVMMFSDRDGEFAPRAYGHGKRMMMGGPDARENLEIMAFGDCEKSGKKDCAPPRIFPKRCAGRV